MNDGHREGGSSPVAFLLAQVGAYAAEEFAKALAPLKLNPCDAGILRLLRNSPGISQQDLARRLDVHASRLVSIIDDLESGGLVLRDANANDRRTYSLKLTDRGHEKLKEIGQVARHHNETVSSSLNHNEQAQLATLLEKIAAQCGLKPGIHPGYKNLDRKAD